MALGLVGRSARALSDHLNLYYRVFRGIDADSVWLRLATGGSFEVRHSVTNAPVLKVTDTGANLAIGSEDIAPGTINSSHIADGTIVDADVAAGAAIAHAKLATVSPVGAVLKDTGGGVVGGGLLVDANIATGAVIALSKLAPGSSGVLKSNGTAISAGNQVAAGDIGAAQIADVHVANGAAIAYSKLNLANSIVTGDIAPNTILDADVAAAAAIAVTKVAHVGAGNVLRSNGTTNAAGQVANGDLAGAIAAAKLAAGGTANRVVATADGTTMAMAQVTGAMIAAATMLDANFTANTISGNKIADASIPSAKLVGGATIPANSIDSTHIVDGSIQTADIQAGAVSQVLGATPSSSNPTITGPTAQVVPQMSVPITTTGGVLVAHFNIEFSNGTAGNRTDFSIRLDGANTANRALANAGANANEVLGISATLGAPAAGAHTVDVTWAIGSGGGTTTSGGTQRMLTVIENKR